MRTTVALDKVELWSKDGMKIRSKSSALIRSTILAGRPLRFAPSCRNGSKLGSSTRPTAARNPCVASIPPACTKPFVRCPQGDDLLSTCSGTQR